MQEITLAVQVRKSNGTKKELSELRAKSQIPAVIYGGAKPPVHIVVSEKEFLEARKKGGLNAVMHMKVGSDTETVVLKDLQRHPVTEKPVHADFQRISLTQKIEAKVPLHIAGEAPGVKLNGGVLEHELRVLTVKALPTKIPQFIEVDVSALQIGQHILIKELKIPADVELLENPDRMVVHVTLPKVQEAAPAPAAVEAAAAAAAAPAEPESSSTKGKKDEEGKVIPKAAPAPGAEKGEKGKEPAKK